MEGERHNTKRQGEADGERSAEKAMVEGRDGRTKEGRGGRAARTDREQTAPAGHFETFAKNASYMGGLREGWIEKHSNKEEATGGTGRGCSDVTHNPRAGKLHGFESSNIEQRRCAEGDREAVSRRRPALLAAPWRGR